MPDTFFSPGEYAHIHPELGEILNSLPQPPEGHVSPEQAEFLFHLVKLIRPVFVAETGFCTGHSACIVMLAQASLGIEPRMLSFDICRYEETKVAAGIVKSRFPGLKFVEGDTKAVLSDVLRRQLRRHDGITLDLGIIDGGHDHATAAHDLETLFAYLKPGGFLWLDDFEKLLPNAGVNLAGHDFARRWGNCLNFQTRDARGFMLHQKKI
jgi:predicted O-methyltransferase YrrM